MKTCRCLLCLFTKACAVHQPANREMPFSKWLHRFSVSAPSAPNSHEYCLSELFLKVNFSFYNILKGFVDPCSFQWVTHATVPQHNVPPSRQRLGLCVSACRAAQISKPLFYTTVFFWLSFSSCCYQVPLHPLRPVTYWQFPQDANVCNCVFWKRYFRYFFMFLMQSFCATVWLLKQLFQICLV